MFTKEDMTKLVITSKKISRFEVLIIFKLGLPLVSSYRHVGLWLEIRPIILTRHFLGSVSQLVDVGQQKGKLERQYKYTYVYRYIIDDVNV